jgi:very-short-patch-repair endonuclease
LEIFNQDVVQEHLRLACDWLAEKTKREFQQSVVQRLESPAGAALQRHLESVGEAIFEIWFTGLVAYDRTKFSPFLLIRQFDVEVASKRYRLDFTIAIAGTTPLEYLPVAIELDGHAFHEKTPEQVTARNERDRHLQAAGYEVIHFSYSELTGKPVHCVVDAMRVAWLAYEKTRKAE